MVSQTLPYDKKDKSDQRYFPRWEVNNRIVYQMEDNLEKQEGFTMDLSCAGVRIRIAKKLVPKQKIKMTIYLSEHTFVHMQGDVIWAKILGNESHVGVVFFNKSGKAEDLILEYAFNLDKDRYLKHLYQGWEGSS